MASGHNSSVFTRSAWFYCEFDPLSKYGRMPRLFCREYYDIIPNQVLFCDENNNEIEVSVLKHLGRIYFIDGWRQIGNLYNVQEGAWLKLYYLSETEFMMSIQNRWMVEVDYPQPPRTVKLGVVSHTVIILDDEDDNPSGVCKSEQIDFSVDKMFTGTGKMANGEGSSHSRKHRWFYCEYDPLSKYGRMPRLFCRDFYDTIPSCILIRGVNGNEFEVSVVKKKGRIYLTGGWHQLGHLYNLPKGGWLKTYFLDDNEFIITVMNRELVEIEQQGEGQVRSSSLGLKDSHQQRPKLAPMASPTDDGGGNNKDSTNVCKDKHPAFSIEKRSTKRQLRSSGLSLKDSPLQVAKLAPIASPTGQGFKNSHESNGWSINLSKVGASGKNALLIPARIVRNVIPMSQKVIYLHDGNQRHECKLLRRNRRRESECYIGRGWYKFCKEKRLRKGDCLKFYVNDDPHDVSVQLIRC